MSLEEILSRIAKGENETTEFKTRPDTQRVAETICAFANTDGGWLIIGINDQGRIIGTEPKKALEKISEAISAITPYPKVKTETITIDKKKIVIVKVPKSNKIHAYRGKVYIRIGASNRPLSVEEILEKAAESLIIRFDEMPSNAPLTAINIELFKEYLKRREQIRGIPTKGTIEENLKLLKVITQKNGELKPTNAGLLFFSDNPQKWLPNAKVHLVWFTDEEYKEYRDTKFFEGPIWKIIDQIEDYLHKNLKRIGGELIGWRRIEILEYPIRALREAITNAITHRNYLDPAEVKIFITPTKIIIRNPGSFPPGVTPDNPTHKPRNPLIAQYMYDIGYIEKYGYGIKLMKKECEKHPLVKLKFNIRPYITEVIFEKTTKQKLLDKLDKKIVELLKKHGELSSGELAELAEVSKPTILKHIKKLIELNIVTEKGKGPAKRYKLKDL